MVHAGDQHALKGDENDEAVAKDVVVQAHQELGDEERCEAPLAQER